jgi:hypothetical protein
MATNGQLGLEYLLMIMRGSLRETNSHLTRLNLIIINAAEDRRSRFIQGVVMKKTLFAFQYLAVAAGLLLLPAVSRAEPKTAKACEEEWKANKTAIQASGKLKRDFIAECRGTTAASFERTAAPRDAGAKTIKACAAEWTANRDALKASGRKRKDFIAECRGIATTAAAETSAPASGTSSTATSGKKTYTACLGEWVANKIALRASGKTRKEFLAECRGVTTAAAAGTEKPLSPAASAKPTPTLEPSKGSETAVVASTDSGGKRTFKACAAEWIANKATLRASGKRRKDFIAECRGIVATASAAPDKPASAQPARRDNASVQGTGSTIKNPRFSPTAATGQFASEAEAKSRCPGEPVVWANTRSKVWHGSRSKRYGRTKRGVYICLKEASAAGFRAAKRKKRRAKTVAIARS